MTDPRDPIERWLSSDVELLPPPHGAFERVRKSASRRRMTRALTTAAGAAVVIAAGVVLPQMGLLPGHGGPASIGDGHPTPPVTRTTPAKPTGNPTPLKSSAHRTKTPGTGSHRPSTSPGPSLASGATATPPAAGFEPTSVTFISGSVGAVLGRTATGCTAGSCTAAAATFDYGQNWSGLGAPGAGFPDGSSGVSQIRFLNQYQGWAYGPALYSTTDGGSVWTPVTALHGRVTDLATVNGFALAVVSTCSGAGPDFTAGCTKFALYQSAAGSGQWQAVPGASADVAAAPGGLQITASGDSYLFAGGRLFAGPVGGSWHQVRSAAAGRPTCLSAARAGAGAPVTGTGLIAPDGGQLYLACDATASGGGKSLYVSADGGQSWQRSGTIAAAGTAQSLAAIPGGAIVLATTKGIYSTFDTVHWNRASLGRTVPAGGFTFVGMTEMALGVAVPADQALGTLFITRDGGRTWQPTRIG